jgi:hypothetical protein
MGFFTAVIDKDMMVLQNYEHTSLQKGVLGLYGESYQVRREENPVPITFLEIKAEPEVSCMCIVRQITQMCRSAGCLSDLHLSAHAHATTALCCRQDFEELCLKCLLDSCSLLSVAFDAPLPFSFK